MRTIKIFVFSSLIIFGLSLEAVGQQYIRNTVVIDTPTAYTIGRGTYQVSLLGYDEGGIELKTYIGLHDNLYLGVSFDVQNAIGKEDAKPNVPGVVAKLKFTDGWEAFPISFALGYDSFYIGGEGRIDRNRNEEENTENLDEQNDYDNDGNKLNRMIYGPYFVITKPIYLLDDEQHIHFGFRIPTQPDYVPEDSSYFVALDIPLGEFFVFKSEGERIYYDFSRNEDWLLNFGLRYNYMPQLGIEFDLLLQEGEKPNRIIRVEYNNEF